LNGKSSFKTTESENGKDEAAEVAKGKAETIRAKVAPDPHRPLAYRNARFDDQLPGILGIEQ
jgi:hypothetical protein